MTKLLENTFRAANIALINEIANYCYELDVNVRDVISAAATKPYGFMPFWPGPGVGGHCIPCDPHYLAWQLRTRRVQTPLLDAVMTAIANRPGHVVRRVVEALAERGVPLRCARILIYGVSYKPNVSDVRESPALQIITQLLSKVSTVAYFDPRVPALRAGMTTLSSLTTPAGVWDLVLLHTLHDDDSLSWLCTQQCVLDATYRLPASDSVITL
jgi:nucleotide sugar dehydrogenase